MAVTQESRSEIGARLVATGRRNVLSADEPSGQRTEKDQDDTAADAAGQAEKEISGHAASFGP